jgi:hypothetical protein
MILCDLGNYQVIICDLGTTAIAKNAIEIAKI